MPSVEVVSGLLRRSSEQLIALAGSVDPTAPSAASEWSIAQVYSHLGSGAEIGSTTLRVALGEAEAVVPEDIWARWNAYEPRQMVDEFVIHARRLLDHVDGLDPAVRDSVTVPFFIGPIDLATYLLFRLSEHILHSWDVRVALNPAAEVDADAAPLVLENVTARLVGFLAKRDPAQPACGLAIDGALPLYLALGDTVELRAAAGTDEPTGTLAIDPPALLRLTSGRLAPDHTPAGVRSEGTPTLDDLRAVFPGY